jgi:hypothetical protein
MKEALLKLLFYPRPLRVLLLGRLLAYLRWGSYETRLRYDAMVRPWYGYCIWHAAKLAKALDGVAGGRGLLNIEDHVREIERNTGVSISVYGFDTGEGLPPPEGYLDLPYLFKAESYGMDRARLEAGLERSKLVIGNVKDTLKTFVETYDPPPIGAVMFDLDYYSSTRQAFSLFDYDTHARYLPRIFCYFDDVTDDALVAYNEYTGVLRAIRDFNDQREHCKIAKINSLYESRWIPAGWNEKIYVTHYFTHDRYNSYVSDKPEDLPM